MGGIAAIIGPGGRAALAERLELMLGKSAYRGDPAVHVEDDLAVAVQTRRGDAALARGDGWVVAFCGYVGNWRELARDGLPELRDASSDAERVHVAYRRLGDGFPGRLRGEFSLLVVDHQRRRAIAARDILGCSPLFFEARAGRMYLASEIRQVIAGSASTVELDDDVVVRYLLGYQVPDEATVCRPVRRILPAAAYELALGAAGATWTRRTTWTPPAERRARRYDAVELSRELRALLERAVDRALPERPFAVALSGGIDSPTLWTLIAARARAGDPRAVQGRPVSMVYPGMPCDERPLIGLVARRTGADPIYIDASGFRPAPATAEVLARIDALCPPTFYQLATLLSATRADGRDVLLTGLGPDEWLWGSTHVMARHLLEARLADFVRDVLRWELGPGWSRTRLLRRELRAAAGALLRGPMQQLRLWSPLQALRKPRWIARRYWLSALRHSPRREADPVRDEFRLYLDAYQSGTLVEPVAQLAASLDVQIRQPLLDLDLVEFGLSVPARALTDGRRPKQLLRQSVADLLPRAVIDGRKVLFDCVLQEELARLAQIVWWETEKYGKMNFIGLDRMMEVFIAETQARRIREQRHHQRAPEGAQRRDDSPRGD